MFNLSYTSPCPIQGELKLKRNPLMHGLGYYKDIDGVSWDVNMIVGGEKPYVCARLVQGSYYSTAGNPGDMDGSHTWLPYSFTVEEKNEN